MQNDNKSFSSEIKVIDELFPKGKVSILASGPGVGKTIFACKIARWLTYHRERVLYVNMASDHINVDTSDDDTLAWKCSIFDMPLLSIEDISFVLSRRYTFDTIILDYIELMDFVKGIECLERKEELNAIWHFLDHIAKEKNIRVIGLSQLERGRIDGTEESCFDKVLKYLNRDFVRERLVVLHRPSYYEPQDNNTEQVQLITFKNGIKKKHIRKYKIGKKVILTGLQVLVTIQYKARCRKAQPLPQNGRGFFYLCTVNNKDNRIMTFKELLNSVTFDEVAPCLLQMHPDSEGNLKWYKIHFDMLRLMTPKHHDDANSDVCHISMSKWDEDSEPHLDAHPMEGDYWEHSLTKEIVIDPEVKATNAEIAACCIWHTSFYGFVREHQEEDFRFFKLDKYHKDRWDDFVYNKARAERYYSVIRRHGGYIPSVRELAPSKKQELFSKAKDYFWCISASMNRIKRKKMFRREFMAHYYERMAAISRFIVQAIPALSDERNNMSMDQLCGLFQSDLFSPETITSYADENTNGVKYLCELLEIEDINTRLDRMVVVLTTGEWHQELTDDEQRLCKLLIGDCKSSDILVATDPSLGRQVRIDYATFNSEHPLIGKQYEKEI